MIAAHTSFVPAQRPTTCARDGDDGSVFIALRTTTTYDATLARSSASDTAAHLKWASLGARRRARIARPPSNCTDRRKFARRFHRLDATATATPPSPPRRLSSTLREYIALHCVGHKHMRTHRRPLHTNMFTLSSRTGAC